MRRALVIACLLLLAAGWMTWSLRAASSSRELGHPPDSAPPTTIAAIHRDAPAFVGKMVSVTGWMTQRCPTAGCWFYLNDGTGDLRVDAQPGGFTVMGLPMGARLTVFGTVVREPGEDPQFAAVGVRW
jgi:hypothetical protein